MVSSKSPQGPSRILLCSTDVLPANRCVLLRVHGTHATVSDAIPANDLVLLALVLSFLERLTFLVEVRGPSEITRIASLPTSASLGDVCFLVASPPTSASLGDVSTEVDVSTFPSFEIPKDLVFSCVSLCNFEELPSCLSHLGSPTPFVQR